jgi:hypothetical protein
MILYETALAIDIHNKFPSVATDKLVLLLGGSTKLGELGTVSFVVVFDITL